MAMMDSVSFLLTFLIYVFVASPLCLLLHEMGHAVMILLLTRQRATFQFGVSGARRNIRLGRITASVYFEPSALFFCRYRLEEGALTRSQSLGITLGGPLASLVSGLLFGLLWMTAGGDPWTGLTIISLINLLNSSIPRPYPAWQGAQAGLPNDGMQLVRLFQASRS